MSRDELRELQMEANPFLDAFIEIDADENETIDTEELKRYMKRKTFSDSFAKRWLATFDLNRDGTITLEEFCQVLGLKVNTARAYRRQRLQQQEEAGASYGNKQKIKDKRNASEQVNESISVISSSASPQTQSIIVEAVTSSAAAVQTLNQINEDDKDTELANEAKQRLDSQLGRMWHVVIVRGWYSASYSHVTGCSMFFRFGNRIFLVWKTPCLNSGNLL